MTSQITLSRVRDFTTTQTTSPLSIFKTQGKRKEGSWMHLASDPRFPELSVSLRADVIPKSEWPISLRRGIQKLHAKRRGYQKFEDTFGNSVWLKKADVHTSLLFPVSDLQRLTFDHIIVRAHQVYEGVCKSQEVIPTYQKLLKENDKIYKNWVPLNAEGIEYVTKIAFVHMKLNTPILETCGLKIIYDEQVFYAKMRGKVLEIYLICNDRQIEKSSKGSIQQIYDVTQGCFKALKIYKDYRVKELAYKISQLANPKNELNYVVEAFETEFTDALVMKFYPEGDLYNWIENTHTPEEIWNCCRQVITGGNELLKRGILHSDMKPENILVESDLFRICDLDGDIVFDPKSLTRIFKNQKYDITANFATANEWASITTNWEEDSDSECLKKAEQLLVFSTAVTLFLILTGGFTPFDSDPEVFLVPNQKTYKIADLIDCEAFKALSATNQIQLKNSFFDIFFSKPEERPTMEEFTQSIVRILTPEDKEKEAKEKAATGMASAGASVVVSAERGDWKDVKSPEPLILA